MNLNPDQKTALANEARRQTAEIRLAAIRGQMDALTSAAQVISSLSQDASKVYSQACQDLETLKTGAGPGLTSDFGALSHREQLARKERYAGIGAVCDYVKANPKAEEADALKAWREAALKATGRPTLIQDPAALGQIYREDLLAAGKIKEATWEQQRAWIAATPKGEVLGQ